MRISYWCDRFHSGQPSTYRQVNSDAFARHRETNSLDKYPRSLPAMPGQLLLFDQDRIGCVMALSENENVCGKDCTVALCPEGIGAERRRLTEDRTR
jgi:hypothetical protein